MHFKRTQEEMKDSEQKINLANKRKYSEDVKILMTLIVTQT